MAVKKTTRPSARTKKVLGRGRVMDEVVIDRIDFGDGFYYSTPTPTKPRRKKPLTPEERLMNETLKSLPTQHRTIVKEIANDPMGEGARVMMERAADFRSPVAALFAGIAMVAASREAWENHLDEKWAREPYGTLPVKRVPEVVVGGGLHGAIYAAARVAAGKPAPIVIDESERVGGVFAVSRKPSFYLNSRNRPGDLSVPGLGGALNFLPGAALQPADISAEEYMTNADLAYVIRTTLALTGAKVYAGDRVRILERSSYGGLRVQVRDEVILAARVIDATGIGRPRNPFPVANDLPRYVTFNEFMGKMDEPFPLRDMRRVAVLGAGDSGRVTVEALAGQGPISHWSVASLDWPGTITWYGQPSFNRQDFEACNRTRYKKLGTLLQPGTRRPQRVYPSGRARYVQAGPDSVEVDGAPYDLVVNATGFEKVQSLYTNAPSMDYFSDPDGGKLLARRTNGDTFFKVGPAAEIEYAEVERLAFNPPGEEAQREAEVAMYRLAGRTARLAMVLP